MSTQPIMDRLRETTRAAHQTAENNPLEQAMIRGELPRDLFVAWLGQRWIVHRELERGLLELRSGDDRLHNVIREDLLQEPHLQRDLEHYGVALDALEPTRSAQRFIDEFRRAVRDQPVGLLGYLYVFEGSKNGAAMIARAAGKAYGASPDAGLSYLDPHGDKQRPLWMEFKHAVNDVSFDDLEEAAIVGLAERAFVLVTALDNELYTGAQPAARGSRETEPTTTAP